MYFNLSGEALASRKHPGGTQEHPGGTNEARDILESKCVISYVPTHRSDRGE